MINISIFFAAALLLLLSPAGNPRPGSGQAGGGGAAQARNESPEEDIVYAGKDVDVKAVITSKPRPLNGRGCPSNASATLRVVLHKSGKVTGIKVVKQANCRLDRSSVEEAGRLEFEPARKGGAPVSQYATLRFTYTEG